MVRPISRKKGHAGHAGRGMLLAVGTVAVAFVLALGLDAWTGFAPVLLFHAATVATTWWAGPAAGGLAAAASFVLAERYFLPQSAFFSPDLESVAHAAVFVIASSALVTGVATLRTALRQASASARRTDLLARRIRRKRLESERAASRYQRLQEVAAALLRSLTPAQVMDVILRAGVTAAEADTALLALPVGSRLDVVTTPGCPGSLELSLRDGRSEAVAAALAKGEPAWLSGSPLAPDVEDCGMAAWAVLPLWARDRRIGALALGYGAARVFTTEDRTFGQLLAQQCAQALDRARLYQSERAARVQAQFAERRLGFLAGASASLAATLDTGRSLAEVADQAATSMGDFCAIHVLDAEGRARLAAGSVTTATGLVRFGGDEHRYELDPDSDVGYPAVLRSGRPELLSDIDEPTAAEAGAAGGLDSLRRLGLRSQICVPLLAREAVFGAITVASTERGRRMTSAELTLTEDLARRVAQALDSAQLYRTALQASRAKSDFLAVMSHELRTPLNAILGYADLILMGVPSRVPEDARHQVERVRSAATHLLQLVDDVLNFARVESGRDRVRVESVPLAVVIAEAIGMVQPLAAGKGLALRHGAPAGAVLQTDGGKLVRILHNLLSNAVKFTDSGSVEVEGQVVGDDAVVTVTDTGIGIPPEHRERIFDPFWQVEQSSTRRFGGAGIGLGVARHLAQLLGGDLVVRSTPGEGSTFELRVPLRYSAGSAGPA